MAQKDSSEIFNEGYSREPDKEKQGISPIRIHIMGAQEYIKTAEAAVAMIVEDDLKKEQLKLAHILVEDMINKTKEQIEMAKIYGGIT
jgi:hypothetical protein